MNMSNIKALDAREFTVKRRSALLDFSIYKEITGDAIETLALVGAGLSDLDRLAKLPADRPMISAEERAWSSLDLLHVQYTAGDRAENLALITQEVLSYWRSYAALHVAFHKSAASGGRRVPHADLHDTDYWKAIRLTSFALLLGHHTLLPQIAALWDYENDELDGLLERLVAPFAPGRATPPDTCTRHLPYFKLLKVFAAEPHKRPDLMARYMDGWYTASRREPYYESHTKGRDHSFLGYWAFEAAAVTYLLDIDDSSYRNHEFYPRDLIDFARSLPRPVEIGGSPTTLSPGVGAGEPLRCPAGHPCPKAGWWFAPADPSSRRVFKVDEVMPDLPSAYGKTIWQFEAQQSDGSAT
jgi:hypothetical protein